MSDTHATPNSDDVAKLAASLRRLDICMLTTHASDGTLHGRPMSNNGEVEYDGDNWFFARDGSRKVTEIEADGQVELAFIDSAHATWVNVEGEATIVRDEPGKKRDLWQPDLKRWFENGPEDAGVVLIKVAVRHVDAWSEAGDLSF